MRFWEILNEEGDRKDIERAQVALIRKKLETALAEQSLLGKNFITLIVGDKKVDVNDIFHITNNVKADAAFLNPERKPVAFISLKNYPSFRWGGFVEIQASTDNHDWLEIFTNDVEKIVQGTFLNGESLRLDSISSDLEKNIMYGKDYPSEKRGIHNVDAVYLGRNFQIQKSKNDYVLISDKVYVNGDDPSDEDRVILNARFSSKSNNAGILKCRLEAEPARYALKRNSLPIDTDQQVKSATEEFHRRRKGEVIGLRKLRTRVERPLSPPYSNPQDALDKLVKYIKRSSPLFLKYYDYKEKENALRNITDIMRKNNIAPNLAINIWKRAGIDQE